MKRLLSSVLLFAALLLGNAAQAQETAYFTLTSSVDSTAWIALPPSAVAPATAGSNDERYMAAVADIGFSFHFGAENYSQFSCNSNSTVKLGSEQVRTGYYSTPFSLANYSQHMPKIIPFGADLAWEDTARHYIRYATVGAAPNRTLVIEMCLPTNYSTVRYNDTVKMQVQLCETSNKIRLVYGHSYNSTTYYGGSTATAGYQIGLSASADLVQTISVASNSISMGTTSALNSAWPALWTCYELTPVYVSCPRTTLPVASAVDSVSATLTWCERGTATSWLLEYGTTNALPGDTSFTTIEVYDTIYPFTNLTPNTSYYGYVRALCTSGDTSAAQPFRFLTSCVAIDDEQLPYNEGFEGNGVSCWTLGANYSTLFPKVYTASSYSHTGNNSLEMYLSSSTGRYIYAVMPQVNHELSGLLLSFYARQFSPIGRNAIYVGTFSDLSDLATFTVLDTIQPATNVYELFSVQFPDTATGRIAFVARDEGLGSVDICVDDISLGILPDCQPVIDLMAVPAVTNATLSWNVNANASTNAPSSFEIRYAPLSDSLNYVSELSSDPYFLLTGLTPLTQYKAWVISDCGSDGYGSADSVYFSTGNFGCATWNTATLDTAEIGTGTGITTLPFGANWNHSYYQALWLASEISHPGGMNINTLAFKRAGTATGNVNVLDDATIYLANVADTSLAGGFVPYDAATFKAMKQGANFDDEGQEYVEYVLDSTFRYDGTSSLLVALDVNMSGYALSALRFSSTTATNMARYLHNDTTAYDITHSTLPASTATNQRVNVRFLNKECTSLATCAAPVVNYRDAKADSVYLFWTPGAAEESFDVFYRAAGAVAWNEATTGTPDHGMWLEGLTIGSTYEALVVNDCGDSSIVSFTTDCGDLTYAMLPYIQDMDDGDLAHCWRRGISTTNPAVNAAYHYSGTRSLSFYGSSSYATGVDLVSPLLAMNEDSVMVSFMMYSFSVTTPSGMVVGMMSNPTDTSTFHPLDTVYNNAASTWELFEVPLRNLGDSCHYVALRGPLSTSYSSFLYVDDLTIEALPPCSRPSAAYVSNVRSEEADVNWIDDATLVPNSYTIFYGTANDISSATSTSATTSPYTLTGLTASTTYYAWLRSECTEGSGKVTALGRFTTKPPCHNVEELSYQVNNVSGIALLSWQPASAGNASTGYLVRYRKVGTTAWISQTNTVTYTQIPVDATSQYEVVVSQLCDTLEASGERIVVNTPGPVCTTLGDGGYVQNYIPANSNYRYSYNQTIYTAEEMRGMGDTIYGISYHVNDYTVDSMWRRMAVYIGNSDVDSFATATSFVPDTLMLATASADGDSVVIRKGAWVHLTFATPFVRDTNRNLVIAIDDNTNAYRGVAKWSSYGVDRPRTLYFYSDSYNMDPDSLVNHVVNGLITNAVPDISFDASCNHPVTCAEPFLIMTASTDSSISLHWAAGGSENSWDLDYRLAGAAAWTNALTASTLTSYTIQGLLTARTYEVRLTPGCGDSTMSRILTFSTKCGVAAVPYVENFNGLSGDFSRACWTIGCAVNGTVPHIANLISYGNMVTMNDDGYMIMPALDADVRNLALNVKVYSSTATAFVTVGVCSDPASMQTFTPIDTLRVSVGSVPRYQTVSFANYSSASGYIAFLASSGTTITYLDDIIVDMAAACNMVNDSSIHLVTTDSTSATVAWSGNATSYRVEYGPMGFRPGSGTTIAASSTQVTLSGLRAGTYYDLYVTAVCSDGNTTFHSNAFTFASGCATIGTLPYVQNFDVTGLPPVTATTIGVPCWNSYALSSSTDMPAYYLGYANSGTYSLRLSGSSITVLPKVTAAPLDTLMLSMSVYGTGTTSVLEIGTVATDDTNANSTFQVLQTVAGGSGRQQVTVYLGGYSGNGTRLAFRNRNTGTATYAYFYIDDLVIDYMPSCLAPVEVHVVDSLNAATHLAVDWHDYTPATSWQLEYGPRGFVQGSGTTMTVSSHPVLITGTESATEYDVYVRAVCASDDTTSWSHGRASTNLCDGLIAVTTAIDNATHGISSYTLGAGFYRYSLSETIIDSAEMAAAGFNASTAITGLMFHMDAVSASPKFDSMVVYLGNTAVSEFSSTTAFVNVDTMNFVKVYRGSFNPMQVGWNAIQLDTTFLWDGHSNVILVVDRNDGAFQNGNVFTTSATPGYKTIYTYSDSRSGNADPFDITGSYGTASKSRQQYRADLQLIACVDQCPAPVVTLTDHDYSSASFVWTGNAVNYEVAVKAVVASEWPAAVSVSGNSYTANSLQPLTQYVLRVRALCDAETSSDWGMFSFTTDSLPCLPPSVPTVNAGFGDAMVSWTARSSETQWNIHVWNTAFDNVFPVSSNPATVGGLTPGQTYYVAVAANCGGGLLVSTYGDTVSFTTEVCAVPTGIVANNVTSRTANISWMAGGNNDGHYVVEYGIEDFVSGSGQQVNVEGTNVTLNDLAPSNTYDVYVRALCNERYPSGWSAKVTFTTESGEGISNVDAARVALYPNPAENSTTVTVSGVEGPVTIIVVDLDGRTLRSETVDCSSTCTKRVDVSHLASGTYFVRIQGAGINSVQKLVVQ